MATRKTTTKKVSKSPAGNSSGRSRSVISSKEKTLSKFSKKKIYLAVAVLIAAVVIFLSKGFFVAAVVNGTPISRLSLIQDLEKQAGKKVLDGAITRMLILQEARKQNIVISAKEIDEEVKKLAENFKQQGQNLDDLLKAQGISKADLSEQIRLQKIVTSLAGKNIPVEEKEIDQYIEKNKDTLAQGQDANKLRANVKEQLKEGKLQQKIQELLQTLREKAKIYFFVNY